jgi:DNA polymerase I-like protein with 3'-5' exonuclease and polymerase domains
VAFKVPRWTVLDFETHAILPRPDFPPVPVGCAIKLPSERKGKYWAWGHPTKNNCTQEEGHAQVRKAFAESECLLGQEMKFDLEVALKHVHGVKMPPWDFLHDTKYMLFLRNPHATSLGLKPSAETYLGMPPEEQDDLRDWILHNVRGAKAGNWGAYIALAPGDLVGKYAIGDVVRTDGLGKLLLPYIHEHGMMEAYDRERRLMPVLMPNEQMGIKVDVPALEVDIPRMEQDIETCDRFIRKRLKNKDLNVNSDLDFANALAAAGIIDDSSWKMTKTGRRSTSKKNLLPGMFKDPRVFQAFSHRNKLSTCVGTFAQSWLDQAHATGGTIHTSHRQVKGTGGSDGTGGARSGRKQTTPNFQNVSKNFNKKDPNYSKPTHLDVLDLPLMRRYLLPDSPKHLWCRRDFAGQELRILAHFESGSLLKSYLETPRYDMHQLVHDGVLEITGLDFDRDRIKSFNFQDIYGGGITAFCESLGCDYATAKRVKAAKTALMPDVQALREDIERHAKDGNPIKTWGGREYFVEESHYVEKHQRVMDFYYKLLNYLIQGSAADATKEALIRYDAHPKRVGRLLIDVHDEIDISVPVKAVKQEMQLLREVMYSLEFDLPMLSDGETGNSWGSLTKFEEPEFNMKKWRKDHGK